MIPQAYITEWSAQVPWQTNEQVEQDLIICRALVEIFSDEWLASSLAFRGGTALHKLYLTPQPRYSEDIDLVQINPGPVKEMVQRLQAKLSFLGEAAVIPKANNMTLKYRFDSETPPIQRLRLKVETNTREHFTVLGYQKLPFSVVSPWFNGDCTITTYRPEEMLGTKVRALYQRSKGRDLFDINKAMTSLPGLDHSAILQCYHRYMAESVDNPPTQKQFLSNLGTKMNDPEFTGDIKALLRPTEIYDPQAAYHQLVTVFLDKLDETRPK